MIDCIEKNQHPQQQQLHQQSQSQQLQPIHVYQQQQQLLQLQQQQLQQQQQQYQQHQMPQHYQQRFQQQPQLSAGQQQHALLTTYLPAAGKITELPSGTTNTTTTTTSSSTTNTLNGTTNSNNNNELIGYYFGSIARETAEWILRQHGKQLDGTYLLRSSGPNDDFVLSLMIQQQPAGNLEVLHYKIVETEDSFVALHGQVGDEKFATIDELIEKAQGVATKPRWPILRQSLEAQILPPTYWGLTVDQVRLAILLKAKQWGFPLLSSILPRDPQQQPMNSLQQQVTTDATNTLSNETIRTLIYKSLHEFQPWYHGKIDRDEAERRIEQRPIKDGKFLVRERDNYSYAMCISHKRTTKHYRIDVLPTGELAIQDGRKFTSLMALVSHYTIMSDGLWCALTSPCPRPIAASTSTQFSSTTHSLSNGNAQNLYCIPPPAMQSQLHSNSLQPAVKLAAIESAAGLPATAQNLSKSSTCPTHSRSSRSSSRQQAKNNHLISSNSNTNHCIQHQNHLSVANSLKVPIKEWLQTINQRWSQLLATRSQNQTNSSSHSSTLNSFLFGAQNPLNNHCRHAAHRHHRRRCKNGHSSCGCVAGAISTPSVASATNGTHSTSTTRNCCNQNLWPVTPLPNNQQPTTIAQLPPLSAQPLHNWPLENSQGFSLLATGNGSSFVGSPLFAVTAGQSGIMNSNQSGSSSSGGGSVAMEEEKLISPAQSVSVNLNGTNNNPYQLESSAIYGSQGSTVLVQDQPQQQQQPQSQQQLQQMSSSSASGSSGAALPQRQSALWTNNSQNQSRQMSLCTARKDHHQQHHQMNNNLHQIQRQQQQSKVAQMAGPIMCGQHVGPAFRYTNCGAEDDENNLKLCMHRPPLAARAADDSQLISHNSQPTGPAALSKFVQFQDGQCLRTHRDTRSIQLAYLTAARTGGGLPLRELNLQQQQSNQHHQQLISSQQQQQQQQQQNGRLLNLSPDNIAHFPAQNGFHSQQDKTRQDLTRQSPLVGKDIDLMDCNQSLTGFDFRYDPRLIKSSSIETLCGAGEDEENKLMDSSHNRQQLDDQLTLSLLGKSNVEIMMSLQSCWFANQQQQQNNILNPVPVNNEANLLNTSVADEICQPVDQPSSILTSLITEGEAQSNQQLDNMRKKHDMDELTTAMLAQLTASLKAQVDLKNKRSGLTSISDDQTRQQQQQQQVPPIQSINQVQMAPQVEADPMELINEFDTLLPNNNK